MDSVNNNSDIMLSKKTDNKIVSEILGTNEDGKWNS